MLFLKAQNTSDEVEGIFKACNFVEGHYYDFYCFPLRM